MERFVGTLGFKSVKIMSPQAHDEIISFTSQLPHAIAVSLINSEDVYKRQVLINYEKN